jgi:tetratricopeptide (TPR) repeat protein
MQFETTRTDAVPDAAALATAVHHARDACRLDPQLAEAWATLGFVLGRTGGHVDALAALRRAVTLEPDNWRHHFRLAYVSWGEERLRAARRTLGLLPGFPLAHWMAATVYVARNVLDDAERELAAGVAVQDGQGPGEARFGAVALHWLRGLIHLARGDERAALEALERELSLESSGQLYARECCANTWYAIGVLRLRQARPEEARLAFRHALDRVATHPLAHVALTAIGDAGGGASMPGAAPPGDGPGHDTLTADAAIGHAAVMALRGAHAEAAALVDRALAAAPPGNAGWLVPVEPLLNVSAHPVVWMPALSRLRTRAA